MGNGYEVEGVELVRDGISKFKCFGFETALMWEKGSEDPGRLESWQNVFL